MITAKRSYADPATTYADRVYDRVIAKGRRSTVATTEAGERYRAFPDGRGVTFVAGKRVVTLATIADVARLVALLRSGDAPGTPDQRETLAALLSAVGDLP